MRIPRATETLLMSHEVCVHQDLLALPPIGDKGAVQRGGMIKAGHIPPLGQERGVPRFQVVAEEHRDISHRIWAEQTSCAWVDWDLRNCRIRGTHQIVAIDPIIRSVPPPGAEMVPHGLGVIGKGMGMGQWHFYALQ